MFILDIDSVSKVCMLNTTSIALNSYMYTADLVLVPDVYVGQIEVLVRARTDRPKVGDDVNNDSVNRIGIGNVITDRGLVGEIDIRARDF